MLETADGRALTARSPREAPRAAGTNLRTSAPKMEELLPNLQCSAQGIDPGVKFDVQSSRPLCLQSSARTAEEPRSSPIGLQRRRRGPRPQLRG